MRYSVENTPAIHQLTRNPRLGLTYLGCPKPMRNRS